MLSTYKDDYGAKYLIWSHDLKYIDLASIRPLHKIFFSILLRTSN